MKGKRYSEEQIVRILGEVESVRSVAETARQYGVSEGTIHRWRKKFGGMEISEVRRLRELQAENARLKRIVARRTLASARRWTLMRSKSCCGENGEP
jgi:putative transposase